MALIWHLAKCTKIKYVRIQRGIKAMKNRLFTIITILSLLIISSDQVYAGEKLKKHEIMNLLSGNTVNGYFMKQKETILTGRVDIRIKFFSDGSAEKFTHRLKDGDFAEKGNWFVNKKGGLCVKWQSENKNICGRLERTSDGKYELSRKKQKIIYEEIIPGT